MIDTKQIVAIASQMSYCSGSAVQAIVTASEARNNDVAVEQLEQAIQLIKAEIDAKKQKVFRGAKEGENGVAKVKRTRGPNKKTRMATETEGAITETQPPVPEGESIGESLDAATNGSEDIDLA